MEGGSDISKYLKPFKVDLFLSANEKDVQEAINQGIAAARILPYEGKDENKFKSGKNSIWWWCCFIFWNQLFIKLKGWMLFRVWKEKCFKSYKSGPLYNF